MDDIAENSWHLSKMLRIIFPCMPYALNEIEPVFEPQMRAAEARGLSFSFLSYEDFQQEGRVVLRPRPEEDELLLLRGWMLKPEEYARIGRFLTSAEHYREMHWMDGWYKRIPEFTAETRFLEERPEIEALLAEWGQAFVKDRVKSCTVHGLPIVSDWAELQALRETMIEFRGEIEGGLCLRRVEAYTEECRIFVWRGQVHHRDIAAPALKLAQRVATRFDSPFFTIDLGLRVDGEWRVIELGDGQVSDLKEWTPEDLFAIF